MGATVTAEELAAARAAFRTEARRGEFHTGRYRLRYSAWGDGPPVVFVHGMAGAADQFVMVRHRLASGYTTVAYELPDGLTDGAALGRYTLREYVADLLALFDHLGYRRAAVLGSSFGSIITLSALVAYPDRFTAAVLQGGFARRPLSRWEVQAARLGRFLPGWFGDWPVIYRAISVGGNPNLFRDAPPAVADFFLRSGGMTTCRAAAVRGLTLARTDLRSLLPTIRTPLLLVGGDQDELVPRWCEAEVEAGVPGARRVEIAGCGHYPQFTHPGPMAAAVAEFLGGPAARTGPPAGDSS
ncbi:MAG: alpha/beta hydrolase [Gemmataceae bacterium]|nr:alpha/beta hydrolase [Gemmataceae bacterium]